jgi:hypothetical protein
MGLVLPALALAASVVFGGPSANARSVKCGPPEARTIVRTDVVRVYLRSESAVVCTRGRPPWVLGNHSCYGSSSGCAAVGAIAAAGRYVAYDRFVDGGGQHYQLSTVAVRDAVTRRLVTTSRRGEIGTLQARVWGLVVGRRGHAAWLWETQRDRDRSITREVRRSRGCGPQVLDSGLEIERGTLRLRDSELSWLKAGLPQKQVLCPRQPQPT